MNKIVEFPKLRLSLRAKLTANTLLQRKLYQIMKRWRWWWWLWQWYDCTKVNWAAVRYHLLNVLFSLKHLFHLQWTATWGYDMTKTAKIYRALKNWRQLGVLLQKRCNTCWKVCPLVQCLLLCLHQLLATGGILFWSCPCVCLCVCDHRILEACMQYILQTSRGNFTKNATSVKCGTGMNQLDFEIKRSKVKVTARSQMVKYTLSETSPHLSPESTDLF